QRPLVLGVEHLLELAEPLDALAQEARRLSLRAQGERLAGIDVLQPEATRVGDAEAVREASRPRERRRSPAATALRHAASSRGSIAGRVRRPSPAPVRGADRRPAAGRRARARPPPRARAAT